MSPLTCPTCNASLSPQEISDGWCESCGKKIPSWVQKDVPPSAGAGYPPVRDEARVIRSLTYGPLASRGARLAAAILDGLLAFAILALGGALMNALGVEGDEAREGFVTGVVMGGWGSLLLAQTVLLSMRGQTLGKIVVHIRIVRMEDDGNPGFLGAVLLRAIVPALICAIPCVGHFFALADNLYIFADDRRCLHDHIAGTKVIRA